MENDPVQTPPMWNFPTFLTGSLLLLLDLIVYKTKPKIDFISHLSNVVLCIVNRTKTKRLVLTK